MEGSEGSGLPEWAEDEDYRDATFMAAGAEFFDQARVSSADGLHRLPQAAAYAPPPGLVQNGVGGMGKELAASAATLHNTEEDGCNPLRVDLGFLDEEGDPWDGPPGLVRMTPSMPPPPGLELPAPGLGQVPDYRSSHGPWVR